MRLSYVRAPGLPPRRLIWRGVGECSPEGHGNVAHISASRAANAAAFIAIPVGCVCSVLLPCR